MYALQILKDIVRGELYVEPSSSNDNMHVIAHGIDMWLPAKKLVSGRQTLAFVSVS